MHSEHDRVVVTGAFGNLGTAVTRAFAMRGARLALLDLGAEPAELKRASFAADPLILGGIDLTRLDAARSAMEKACGHLGGIDVLVNVAGGFRWQKVEGGDAESWDFMYAVNLKTTVTACQAALPLLLKRGAGGRIINIGAGAAAKAAAGMGAYAASKAGVQRLTESLSEEVKDRGITVNAVLPGTIDTPQNRADMPDADFTRWVPAAAIADVIVFLASDQARAITGASIPIFGCG